MTVEASGYNILSGQITNEANSAYNVAILFDYIQDESTTVEADITDNWVESNYSIQDHIAIKPRMYRLRGCVGEVVYENTWAVLDAIDGLKAQHPVLAKTIGAVGAVSSLSGIVSNYTKLAINTAKQIESSVDRYKKVWQNFTKQNQFVNKRQKAVYATLQQMLQTRTPVKLSSLMFTLEPFIEGQYDKLYYLQSVSAHQGDNAYISDIEVTIKEFRIAATKTTKVDKNKYAGMIASQKTSSSNNGDAKGNTVSPETAQKAVGSVAEKNKEVAKAALKGKPMAYNAAKTFYNSLQKAATTGFIPIGK
ncbi:MAG: hypothetical protein II453_09900 [Alphaproteobacteria bacterium]|nr:hypothetical protein [Alphaproteobacteria bacterium]MBQ3946367.1 hypothetical protein [Alphaproteobacteria bacterium]